VHFESAVKKVGCGGGHTGLLTKEGELYLMGRGRDGQLGRGSKVESIAAGRAVPTIVDDFQKNNQKVDDFALGANHTLAVTSFRLKTA
jgi:alpha-tubulin suppressor-like RCC1 family protein